MCQAQIVPGTFGDTPMGESNNGTERAMTGEGGVRRDAVQEDSLRIVFVGHVDHGKSTLVGRLLHETDSVLPSRLRYVEDICRDRGVQFEYAFLLDALEEEQDQGVTIDVSQVLFKTKKRMYRVIDAPGHKEFLKNMISGASGADAALLLIDAAEGLREQSMRHATILSLLGIDAVIVVINKMDLVQYRQEVFDQIVAEYSDYLKGLGVRPKAYVPVSAYVGDNVVLRTSQMKWYTGPTVLELLDGLESPGRLENLPFRMPLQDVYRFDPQKRILAGRIVSGKVKVGDEVSAGESIGLALEDQIFVERGEIACHPSSRLKTGREIHAHIFWMGDEHIQKGKAYQVKLTTEELEGVVQGISRVVNSSTLQEVSAQHREVAKNEVAEISLRFKKDIAFDTFDEIEPTGRFVLVDQRRVSGGGIILKR